MAREEIEFGDSRNVIGCCENTELEDYNDGEFRGETMEVGLYLAMARQAQREGFPEIGRVLEDIAWDEAYHAARFAELNGRVSESTEENLEKMLKGERGANRHKLGVALEAVEAGIDEAHDCWNEASRDEHRHAEALRGLLERHF
ncbi:MAG: hypothetical protein MAG715_01016 [Methanonatronarchaeales archaeon]|nr:hypothetical protein [Methanonatronarchaeales archaeon]